MIWNIDLHCVPKIQHSSKEKEIINSKIQNLLHKRVTVQCDREPKESDSRVLCREKKDASSRTVLNLKYLNEFANFRHFKMESLKDVFKTIKKDVWMTSFDLKDYFFTVPMHILHHEFFMFECFSKWLLKANADFYKNLVFQHSQNQRSYLCYICWWLLFAWRH